VLDGLLVVSAFHHTPERHDRACSEEER
jgi:hypothetical protein